MCRHLGWLGQPRSVASLVLDPPSGLLVQSYAPRRQKHGLMNADGWGVGFFDVDGVARRWRSAAPLWGDASFASVAPALRSGCVVAAVRSVKPPASDPVHVIIGAAAEQRHELSWYETKPLFGWRVLVPRTKDQAAPMVARLRTYGAHSEEVPTISVEPPRSPHALSAGPARSLYANRRAHGLSSPPFQRAGCASRGEPVSPVEWPW